MEKAISLLKTLCNAKWNLYFNIKKCMTDENKKELCAFYLHMFNDAKTSIELVKTTIRFMRGK